MNQRLKNFLMRNYITLINGLHAPLVKKGVDDPYHKLFDKFISLSKQVENASILEIGSRNVTSVTRRDLFPNAGNYVGFDILEGEGVDIVGDAHNLTQSVSEGSFDFVYSVSVLEHILFPWKAVLEINKVLITGGHVFVSTHPVWPTHELPWDFWRFPQNGFHALFNQYTGFEILSLTEGLPCKTYSLVDDGPTRTNCMATMNQGVAVIARKTDEYRSDLLKWDIDVSQVLDTVYPSKD